MFWEHNRVECKLWIRKRDKCVANNVLNSWKRIFQHSRILIFPWFGSVADNRIDLDNSSVVASIIVLTYWTIRIVSKRNFNEYTVITELKNKMIKGGGGRGERGKSLKPRNKTNNNITFVFKPQLLLPRSNTRFKNSFLLRMEYQTE